MPRQQAAAATSTKKTRDYDQESGVNRVKTSKTKTKKSRSKPVPESDSESEVSASDSEVEEEYDIKVKDTHRVKAPAARTRKAKPQRDQQNDIPGEEPEEPASLIAPAFSFLTALAYRQGTSAVQHDERSYWIPDCYALFSAAFFICELITPNSLVHEFDPAFMSITFYLYVGHLFYYQILRVRDVVGDLTREERRCLRHYETVGPAEAWPIPTPLIGILSSYAYVSPPSKFYGKIIPKFPALTGFTAAQSLVGIGAINSITRIPIIPAMQQFLNNFGRGLTSFDDDILFPVGDHHLTAGAAGPPVVNQNLFLGLNSSAANGAAQALFFNSGWNMPTESGTEPLNFPYTLKQSLINRFRTPDIGNTATITGIESFLGFRDGQSNAWMKNLLRSASTVCRFFPDSANLSAVPLITQEEIISSVMWTVPAQRVAVADEWYRGRSDWNYTINGKVNTESSGSLYRAAATASPNADFNPLVYPAAWNANAWTPNRTGPYFVNAGNTVSVPLTLVEIVNQPDPIRNMLPIMDEQLYDNLGGRARA